MKNKISKLMVKFGGCIAALALMITACNINTTCIWFGHQPELPIGAEKLKKSI